MRQLRNSFAICSLAVFVSMNGHAQTEREPSGLEALMTPEQYRAAGLSRLSEQQREALYQWLLEYAGKPADQSAKAPAEPRAHRAPQPRPNPPQARPRSPVPRRRRLTQTTSVSRTPCPILRRKPIDSRPASSVNFAAGTARLFLRWTTARYGDSASRESTPTWAMIPGSSSVKTPGAFTICGLSRRTVKSAFRGSSNRPLPLTTPAHKKNGPLIEARFLFSSNQSVVTCCTSA